jgi:3-methyladenine DNA glycosylase AlkC
MDTWEKQFQIALQKNDLLGAITILEGRNKFTGTPPGSDKVRALVVLQSLISNEDEAQEWAHRLLNSQSAAARDLGTMLVITFIGSFFRQQPQPAEQLALRIADDPHWEIREWADSLLLNILKADFNPGLALLRKWREHSSQNIRRAVVVAVKKAAKEGKPDWGDLLLDLLEPLLADRSEYVRKNLGPFAIGDGLLRYYPQHTLEHLDRWAESSNEQVRWNVAMVFSAAEGAKHPEAALSILERLATDERRYVWRAVATALRNLVRRMPERVKPILEEWRTDDVRIRVAEEVLKG